MADTGKRTPEEKAEFLLYLKAQEREAKDYVAMVRGDKTIIERYFTDRCATLARERLMAFIVLTAEQNERDSRYADHARNLRQIRKAS